MRKPTVRRSAHQLIDGASLRQFFARHFGIEITVVLDRVPVSVKQSGVPVAQRLVAVGSKIRQPNVATGAIQFAVVASHD